jgi:hypothetical protein
MTTLSALQSVANLILCASPPDDPSHLLPIPASGQDISEAIGCLKVACLLSGYRGRPPRDIDTLVTAILDIQDYAMASADDPARAGRKPCDGSAPRAPVVAADVLIRLIKEKHRD